MTSILLPLAVLTPLVGALVIYWVPQKIHKFYMSLIAAITLLLIALTYKDLATASYLYYHLQNIITPLGLTFSLDSFSFLMALLSTFVWFSVTIFSTSYMDLEASKQRFYFFFLLTLGATVGVILTGDLISLIVFFEVVSLAAYPLVVHQKTPQAYNAGNVYLYMSVSGGLALIAGAAILYNQGWDLIFVAGSLGGFEASPLELLALVLLVAGFGVKAGMVPLHIWLPKAHPVAPTPASALLSGIMIKTGIYGIIRVINLSLMPSGEILLLNNLPLVGLIIIFLGVATMLIGVFMALLQENAKKMLACHSISQIGYILMGIGAAAYLGIEGSLGLAGATYHTINHALFKAALFLVAGAVYFSTKEVNLYRLGGLWRKMPFTAIVGLIAACGIGGVPLFNGYISKTILHHAIEEAYHLEHLRALLSAERLFMLTGAGTACSFIKFYALIFLGRSQQKFDNIRETKAMKIGMSMLALAIIALGIFPNFFLDQMMAPAMRIFTLDDHHLEGHLLGLSFFNAYDLRSAFVLITLGFLIFFVGMRTGIFHLHLPQWLGEEYYGRKVERIFSSLWLSFYRGYSYLKTKLISWGVKTGSESSKTLKKIDDPGKGHRKGWASFINLDFDFLLLLLILLLILLEFTFF